jgi:hypothetical protein
MLSRPILAAAHQADLKSLNREESAVAAASPSDTVLWCRSMHGVWRKLDEI